MIWTRTADTLPKDLGHDRQAIPLLIAIDPHEHMPDFEPYVCAASYSGGYWWHSGYAIAGNVYAWAEMPEAPAL